MHTPEQVPDLLALQLRQGKPRFPGSSVAVVRRSFPKTDSSPQWATIDAALWSMYFARANPKPTAGTSAKVGAAGGK